MFLRHQVKRFYVQEYLAKLGHAARLKREPPKMEDSSWLELEDNEAILQRKVKHLESEIASLTIKLDEANANLSSSDEQLKQTMSTIERLKSHFSGSSQHSDELEARAQAAELKLAEMEAAKNDQQVLVVETASKAKSSKVPDKLVTDLKAKITMLEQENIALRKNSSTQIPASSSSVPSGPSSEQLAKLQDQLGKLEAENSLLTQKLTILMTQQISVAPQAATQVVTQVAPDPATEELLKKVTRELDQAHGTETELRRRISDLESRLTSLTLASQSSPDKNTRDPMMEETLKKVTRELDQAHGTENELRRRISDLESRLNSATLASQSSADADVQEVAASARAQGELNAVRETLRLAQDDLKVQVEKCDEAKTQATRKETECDVLKAQLQEQLVTFETKHAALEGANRKLQNRCDELEKVASPTEILRTSGARGLDLIIDVTEKIQKEWIAYEKGLEEMQHKILMVDSVAAMAGNSMKDKTGLAALADESTRGISRHMQHKGRTAEKIQTCCAQLTKISTESLAKLLPPDATQMEIEPPAKDNVLGVVTQIVHRLKISGQEEESSIKKLVEVMHTHITTLREVADLDMKLQDVNKLVGAVDRDLSAISCAMLRQVLHLKFIVNLSPGFQTGTTFPTGDEESTSGCQ